MNRKKIIITGVILILLSCCAIIMHHFIQYTDANGGLIGILKSLHGR